MTDSKPSSSDQTIDIKKAAARAADEQRSPLSAYLRPFILFVAAAAVILYLITQMGGEDFPANDSPEAGFARDMITHHAQAVEMALIVRDRLPDDASIQFDQFLWDIISTQQNQIGHPGANHRESLFAILGHRYIKAFPAHQELHRYGDIQFVVYDEDLLRHLLLRRGFGERCAKVWLSAQAPSSPSSRA